MFMSTVHYSFRLPNWTDLVSLVTIVISSLFPYHDSQLSSTIMKCSLQRQNEETSYDLIIGTTFKQDIPKEIPKDVGVLFFHVCNLFTMHLAIICHQFEKNTTST